MAPSYLQLRLWHLTMALSRLSLHLQSADTDQLHVCAKSYSDSPLDDSAFTEVKNLEQSFGDGAVHV